MSEKVVIVMTVVITLVVQHQIRKGKLKMDRANNNVILPVVPTVSLGAVCV